MDRDDDKIAPDMIEVGVQAFWSFDTRFEDAEDVVKRIWRNMNAVRNGGAKAEGVQDPLILLKTR